MSATNPPPHDEIKHDHHSVGMDDGGADPTSRCDAKSARGPRLGSRLEPRGAGGRHSEAAIPASELKNIFRLHRVMSLTIPRGISGRNRGTWVQDSSRQPPHPQGVCDLPRPYHLRQPQKTLSGQVFATANVMATTANTFYELVPFGVGRRMCPGYALGNMTVHLILAHTFHSFEWSMPPHEDPWHLDMSEV